MENSNVSHIAGSRAPELSEQISTIAEEMLDEALNCAKRSALDRSYDATEAMFALKAIEGLCATENPKAETEPLYCVNRRDLGALLRLVTERLERAVAA
ncbi:hypothetical protein [Burkholderia cepacia]|uniref:hypothetical protein n=1 Tax=Burkholderia cepacia TaxID=292 RepID=UPI001CF30A0D|nr:hypothetical protein [Burkholderia cepacia]MCA8060686.1 hypothetical protein [Burkholderia cepacia]